MLNDKLGKDAKWGKQACDAHKQANKQVIKQKGVSLKDKCRFGSNVQSSIGLENG